MYGIGLGSAMPNADFGRQVFWSNEYNVLNDLILVVLLVAIPFAALSELVVDHPRLWEKLMRMHLFPSHWVTRRGETNCP